MTDPEPTIAATSPRVRRTPVVWLATGLGVGLVCPAPGTFGTLLGLSLAWGLSYLPPWLGGVAIAAAALASIPVCTAAARDLGGGKDPGQIVLDEIVSLPIVFLTGFGDIGSSVRAIKAGAEDFLSKPVQKHELLEAIKRALVRCDEAQERNARQQALRGLLARLTPREREVFSWVVRGKLNKQIAHELVLSPHTVRGYLKGLFAKVGVSSRTGLVAALFANHDHDHLFATANIVHDTVQ